MAQSNGKVNESELIAALINQCDSLVEGSSTPKMSSTAPPPSCC